MILDNPQDIIRELICLCGITITIYTLTKKDDITLRNYDITPLK